MTEGNPIPSVRAEGLSKHYVGRRARVVAVDDISLSIPSGAFWVIRGPSGCGKSTLLGLLGGMIAPTSGQVHLGKVPLTRLRDHHRAAARRRLVGMVFQNLALIDGMTVAENVLLPMVPIGGAQAADRKRVAELLDRFGIRELAETPIERLSGGERQRAAIVRALVFEPPVLLLDEPSAYVDADNVATILDLLFDLRDEGKTIIAATHDVRLADDPRIDETLELVDGAPAH